MDYAYIVDFKYIFIKKLGGLYAYASIIVSLASALAREGGRAVTSPQGILMIFAIGKVAALSKAQKLSRSVALCMMRGYLNKEWEMRWVAPLPIFQIARLNGRCPVGVLSQPPKAHDYAQNVFVDFLIKGIARSECLLAVGLSLC